MTLAHLSDAELLDSLTEVCFETRRLLGRLLVHLIEVEDRRLELRLACSSLFDLCVRRLHMSESAACRRIHAARLVKRFPCLLDALERGDVHLTGLLLLRDHFTTDNVHELLVAARGKTKRQLEELLAARAPKPDILPTITELPMKPGSTMSPAASPVPNARIEPLSATRHRIELTVSSEVRDKLERARDLLGHRIPNGNLETVIDRALDVLLAKLENERPGARRAVFERDGESCAFTDANGNRCGSRARLEIDHITPRARGGSNDPTNLRLLCRRHNGLRAEQEFGREHIEQQTFLRQRRSEETPVEVATHALVKLGFSRRDVRRKLHEAFPPDSMLPPMPELIRRALSLLT
jgi:hypothetical protein